MSSEPLETRYPDADTQARTLASGIGASLAAAIDARGAASLVVSGGKSPVRLFEALRILPLDWSRIGITLADERWVDATDAASNEQLVRDVLLKDGAADARFIGLKNGAASPMLGAAAAWEALGPIPRPFDVTVLGMGDDGHTASLFPHSPHLSAALDTRNPAACIAMRAPTEPHDRLSLNLSALLESRRIVLLLGGAAKWQVYTAARGDGPVEQMPVRAVLRQERTPVEVVWAP